MKNYPKFQPKKVPSQSQEECVRSFIDRVWNKNDFCNIDNYIDSDFIDHSIPYPCFQNKEGLHVFLDTLSTRTSHHTVIQDLISVSNFVVAEIRICAVSMDATNTVDQQVVLIKGIRLFKMANGKIKEHWEFIE